MFRDGPVHLGVSPETGISSATASTLTAGWTATVGTSSYSSPAVTNLKALGEAVTFVGGSASFSAHPASGGAPLWTFPVSKAVDSSRQLGTARSLVTLRKRRNFKEQLVRFRTQGETERIWRLNAAYQIVAV